MAAILKLIQYLPFLLRLIPHVLPYLPVLKEAFDILDDLWESERPLTFKDKCNIVIDAIQKALSSGIDFKNVDEAFWVARLEAFQENYLKRV